METQNAGMVRAIIFALSYALIVTYFAKTNVLSGAPRFDSTALKFAYLLPPTLLAGLLAWRIHLQQLPSLKKAVLLSLTTMVSTFILVAVEMFAVMMFQLLVLGKQGLGNPVLDVLKASSGVLLVSIFGFFYNVLPVLAIAFFCAVLTQLCSFSAWQRVTAGR